MEGQFDTRTFTEELHWCIGQLELGLQRQSPNSRQAVESIKVLKILKSQKAPIVKKRQVMRNAFGDYRKKMKEAEKKSLSGLHRSRFQSLGVVKRPMASRFLKMSHHKQQNVGHVSGDLDKNLSNLHLQSSVWEPGSSASQNAAQLSSDHPGELVDQACHSSVDSTRECLTNNSTLSPLQDALQRDIQSSNQILKGPKVAASRGRQFTDNASESSSSNHVLNSSNSSRTFSLAQASSSSQNGSGALFKQGTHFKYEPSDNSFTFKFENSQNADSDCCKHVVVDKESEMPDLGKQDLIRVSEKPAASIYKYEQSENDFSFNFEEASDEL